MTPDYLENMRGHVDEGGQLSHQNGVALLAEVERLNARFKEHVTVVQRFLGELSEIMSLDLPEGTSVEVACAAILHSAIVNRQWCSDRVAELAEIRAALERCRAASDRWMK